MKKRLTMAVMLISMMLILMSVSAMADPVWTADWGYEVNRDGTLTINGYYGHESLATKTKALTVPSQLAGVPVTGIKLAIRSDVITKITLPDTLRTIGANAFTAVKNLEEIHLPEGLETIEQGAFKGLKKLKNIRIPSTVKYLSADAFDGCTALPEDYTDGVSVMPAVQVQEEYTMIAADGICYRLYADHAAAWGAEKQGKLKGKIKIPAAVNGLAVTGIGGFAGEKAITEVVLPEGLVEICDNAFSNCAKLKKVTFPSSLLRIGSSSFTATALTSLTLKEGLEVIGERAFEDCKKLSKATLPQSLWQIGSSAFADTGLKAITFPDKITHLPYGVCSECTKLSKVKLPKGLVAIGRFAFGQSTGLKSIELPAGVKIIGHNAFQSTGISKITIPDSVEEIGKGAFAGKKLKQVTVRTRTTKIIMSAFPASVKNGTCWQGTVAERVLKSQKVKVKYLKK